MINQRKENKFNGEGFAGAVVAVVLIALLIFGSTDLKELSNAP